jgi:uncharacterized membrane protein YfcA
MLEIWAGYGLVGVIAGLIAGLFGVGGGLIIVPALVLAFEAQGIAAEAVMHLAVGTSLATIVLTSLSSVYAHHRHGAVLWPVVARLAPGLLAGTLAGSFVAHLLPDDGLRGFFALFELSIALYLGLNIKPSPHRELPGWLGMSLAGGGIGLISALVGIGGGTMTTPLLVWCCVAIQKAIATSAACGVPIALGGSLGFLLNGWNAPNLPAASSGYIYWPGVLGIGACSVLLAPLGAKLAHCLPAARLRQFFALFLALLGLRMLWMG